MKNSDNKTREEEDLVSFYKSLGYRDEDIYQEWDGSFLDNEEDSPYKTVFNLKDNDINIIFKAIKNSAAHHRSSQKSMMTTRNASIIPPTDVEDIKMRFSDAESLIQTRQNHMDEVASLAEFIASALGLNAGLAKVTGEGHDIGHTWNGHTGERILSAIARLKNCGYIVHNAMGPYVMDRENVIEDAIRQVKQFNPKVDEKEVKRFMRYVIDGIVSHNGEGVVGKIIPKNKTAEEMKQELRKCFTEKGYDKSIMPATLEGAIIRFADIMAYTRSDVLDGFRMKLEDGSKILTKFDDEYLSIIGTVLARERNFNKLLTLDYKFSLELYKLGENIKKLQAELETSNNPDTKLELERTSKEREMIQSKYEEFCKYKIQYAQDYIDGIENENEVKTIVTEMMQNVFVKDLIEASKGKDYITMSPLMRKTFFDLRELNSRRIVPFTRKKFEVELLPMSANKLVDICSATMLKTGIAYDMIPDDIKSKYGIVEDKKSQEDEVKKIEEGGAKYDLERKMMHYYTRLTPEKKHEIFINAIAAVKDVTRHDIAIALDREKYDGELKEIYEMTKIIPIRERIGKKGKTSETMTSEDIEKLFNELVGERTSEIGKIVADKIAIEYIGGMTDNTIISYLLSKNLITSRQITEEYGRPVEGCLHKDAGVQNLQKAFAKTAEMIKPDNIPEEEIRL